MSRSSLTRLLVLAVGVLAVGGSIAWSQAFDIGKALAPSFSDIALLPTRLTYYNLHNDSALATYTCCKPSQEEQIRKAIAANAAFLERYPRTDFSDNTCMHNARVNSVRKNFRYQVDALEMLVQQFPDSDLADDAAWRLAQCYVADKDHDSAIEVLNILVTRYPESGWADDGLCALAHELREVKNEPEAVRALRDLAYKYPSSDMCAEALNTLAIDRRRCPGGSRECLRHRSGQVPPGGSRGLGRHRLARRLPPRGPGGRGQALRGRADP